MHCSKTRSASLDFEMTWVSPILTRCDRQHGVVHRHRVGVNRCKQAITVLRAPPSVVEHRSAYLSELLEMGLVIALEAPTTTPMCNFLSNSRSMETTFDDYESPRGLVE